jgi:UDP-glucose 4-epimerase
VIVLITGVAGFIGSHLAEAFTEAGHEVHGIDTLVTGKRENWPKFTYMDVVDDRHRFYGYANDIEPELIIHCAASYADPDKWHRDTDVNVAGAINVAGVARHHDASIIYFQTVLPPISSYAISKIAGEHYLRLSGQPLTVYRLASVYGPRNLSGPIPTFYKRIKAGEECQVVEGVTRDFVFIDDLVERVYRDGAPEGTFDVRSGIETPIETLPDIIGQELGVTPSVTLRPRPDDDVPHYDMDGQPQWGLDLEEGIAHTVRWYEQNGVEQTYTHLAMKG